MLNASVGVQRVLGRLRRPPSNRASSASTFKVRSLAAARRTRHDVLSATAATASRLARQRDRRAGAPRRSFGLIAAPWSPGSAPTGPSPSRSPGSCSPHRSSAPRPPAPRRPPAGRTDRARTSGSPSAAGSASGTAARSPRTSRRPSTTFDSQVGRHRSPGPDGRRPGRRCRPGHGDRRRGRQRSERRSKARSSRTARCSSRSPSTPPSPTGGTSSGPTRSSPATR